MDSILQLKAQINYWSERCRLSENFHNNISVTPQMIKDYNDFIEKHGKAPYIKYQSDITTSRVEETNSTMDTAPSKIDEKQQPTVLSLPEALQAMREGKKVKHRLMADNDSVKSNEDNTIYTFANGDQFPAYSFWSYKTGPEWNTDWIVVD